jgi:recombination protein RecA
MAKKKTTKWLEALGDQGLVVKSARDALSASAFLDTGNYALNWAISGRLLRGYPLGHCVEVFGDPGTGKSFLIARALGMAQEQGGVAMLDDTEGAYNLEWIDQLGVEADSLAYRRSRTVREHLQTATAFIQAYRDLGLKTPGILAGDSLALLSTDHELTTRLDKRDMTKATELKAFFRIVGTELIDIPAVYLAANHTIANIGDMFNKRTTPGGGGLKFQASVRLDLRSISKIKSGGDFVGVICRVVVEKNRIVAPWKEVRLAIPFYRQVSRVSGLIPLLLNLGVLGTTGNFLTYRGDNLGIRTHKTKGSFLKQDQSADELIDLLPELLEETDAILAERSTADEPWDGAEEGTPPEKEEEPAEVEDG